jgi:glycosyltransferase involved in cell wall biosynthesis
MEAGGKPPHVLIIARSFHANGPGNVILNLLRAWRPDQIRVSLLVLGRDGSMEELLRSTVGRLGGKVIVEPAGWFSAGGVARKLKAHPDLTDIDCLVAHLLVPDAVGRALRRVLKKPLLIVEHGIHGWSEKGTLLRPLIREWYVSTLPRHALIVAISEKVRRELIASGVPEEQIRCVPNGVESMADSAVAHTSDRLNVGVVGNLIAAKRPELAIRAAAVARAAGLPVELTFVGDGPCRETLQRLGGSLAVPCHFAGRVADPRDLYAGMAAQLHPSRQESFGLAPLEGLSVGLPVIAAAESGLADLLPPRPMAWLVGDETAEAWGMALVDALAWRMKLGEERRAWVADRYSVARMAADHLAAIEFLLAETGFGPHDF